MTLKFKQSRQVQRLKKGPDKIHGKDFRATARRYFAALTIAIPQGPSPTLMRRISLRDFKSTTETSFDALSSPVKFLQKPKGFVIIILIFGAPPIAGAFSQSRRRSVVHRAGPCGIQSPEFCSAARQARNARSLHPSGCKE